MKNMKKGFTLIELLIVIAIIGILAGVILVSTNSARGKANRSNALQTVKSLSPYLAECAARNATITAPTSTSGGGGAICAGSTTITWPTISSTGCTYANVAPGFNQTSITVTCPAGNFVCTYATGSCL